MNSIDKARKRMFVKPARPAMKIRLFHAPQQGHLPASGAWVPLTIEWRRALRDGDVVLGGDDAKKTKRKRKATEG